MFKIVKSPWEQAFTGLLKDARESIYLASPFIKKQTAQLIAENCPRGLDVRYINSFKLASFYRGASDLDALRILGEHGIKQKSVHNLHAKFFVFDDTAIITSGNLTPGGLRNNIGYGILLKDRLVDEIREDYLKIFNNPDNPLISMEVIAKAEEILLSVPKERQPRIEVDDAALFEEILNDENVEEKYTGGIESIRHNLSSWKKDVFDCLLEIRSDVFGLGEVYSYESRLKKLHPENRNIKPKIRQQLQYLRKLGHTIRNVSPLGVPE